MRMSFALLLLGAGILASAGASFIIRSYFPEMIPASSQASETIASTSPATASNAPAAPRRVAPSLVAPRSRLLNGVGAVDMKITTASAEAQLYFNQGLALAYGFNHAEAAKSFATAAAIDPDCAMCSWGGALVLGPHINALMEQEAIAPAYEAVRRARRLAGKASPREQALIAALEQRYDERTGKNGALRDGRYAEAMRQVARDFPADDDIQVLFAEAQMNRTPLDYWSKEGRANFYTAEIVEVLERVLARNPNHIGANHFIIHALEASPTPERALPSAERLAQLAPGNAGLVQAPSRVYMRLGRYADTVTASAAAVALDPSPERLAMLAAAAGVSGQRAKAMQAAEKIVAGVSEAALRDPLSGFRSQHFFVQKMMAQIRFGEWQTLAEQTVPSADLAYAAAMTHYARGIAFARLGRTAEAETALAEVRALAADPKMTEQLISSANFAASVLAVALPSLEAEIAAAKGDEKAAMAAYAEAAKAEDSLRSMEPADWSVPVRQHWGAYALARGKAAEAERVFMQDLARVRENGWSLNGLAAAFAAQGKSEQAAEITLRFEEAWKAADVKL